MAFFEVNAANGISTSEYNHSPYNMTDVVKIPNTPFYPTRKGDGPIRSFPTNGFELNVEIRYDNLFSNEFSGTEVSRYCYHLLIH